MKKIMLFCLMLCTVALSKAIDVQRMEPANWWVGMENHELQVLLYGKDIAKSDVSISYPGVTLKEVAKVENPNYLFLYLDIDESAKPGIMNIVIKEGKKQQKQPFELRERNRKVGAQGFSTADVIYLITPDRFANGSPQNDNLGEVMVNRQRSGARHGGDIRGIIDHLDYIQELGFTTIWLNPILENNQPGGSYHGYAITDYYHVDPRFGTNEEYVELIDKAHAKGMKVVMDMIFNHSGSSHWWMKDMPSHDWLNNPDEYVQTTHFKWTLMDVHAPQSEKDILVNGWFTRGMPDLNQRNRHLARYLIQNSIWWIEYARIDGIRQDTHPYADYDFMTEWCEEVEEQYPDFNIVGEAWYPRGTASAWWQRNNRINDNDTKLKTVMDFDLAFTSAKAFIDECNSSEGSEAGLFKLYEVIAQDFLFPDPDNILVFLDNHDLGRFSLKEDKDLNKYKQAIAFLATTRGIPEIYYGTEILMTGTKKEGDGVIRTDFPGGWEGDARNAFTSAGRTDKENEAWNYMKTLLNWRKQSKPVTEGKLVHYTPDRSGCYVYARIAGANTVLVLMNGTDVNKALDMRRFHEVIQNYTGGVDVVTGKNINLLNSVEIPARGVYVLDLH
ncbi:MAG: glycoside hydrolase family 13 protein [Bacteroidaceae bacterium]|nr:glycoside hydrolase family 13 protein [Bacteroidaceae bacterium]